MSAYSSTRVLIGDELVRRDVVVAGGRITEHAPYRSVPWARDLGDAVLAPGLVDIQVNGAFGSDFTDDPASIWAVGARLPAHGVTAFCPTIITAEEGTIDRALAALTERPEGYAGAEPLGLHLEGPMISPERKGAHPERFIGPVDTTGWAPPSVRIVTLAPEVVPGGTIEDLVGRGIVVALGHSDADHATAAVAFEAGARHITHLFNAMAPLAHREPGLVTAALLDDRVTVAMIADGVHTHPATLELVLRTVGVDRFVAITDAMAAAGMPAGEYRLGAHDVTTDGTAVRLADGTLAGSVLTMNRSVLGLAERGRIDLAASLRCHTANPVRLLGDVDRGQIRRGARADLVALDDDGSVVLTVVAGTEFEAVRS